MVIQLYCKWIFLTFMAWRVKDPIEVTAEKI